MSALAYAVGVVLFVLGVGVSIGLHELGHLVPAKLFGARVPQYFIGFGKTLWSTKRGETEYGVKAIPLGGFVKIVGALPPGRGIGSRRPEDLGFFARMIYEARQAEYSLVREGDEGRLFYRLAWWKKVVVMGSGVATNLVLGFVALAAMFMVHGVLTPTTTIRHVSDCVIAVTKANADLPPPKCTPHDKVAPAKLAGLRKGDKIVGFNGTPIHSWHQLTHLIRANRNGTATIVVDRNGRRVTAHTNTTVSARPKSAENPETIVRVGFLGVEPREVLVRHGFGYTARTIGDYTWTTVQAVGTLPQKMVGVAKAALGLQPRAQNSPMSVIGASRVAGQVSADRSVPLSSRLFFLVGLLGGLNLFLGMINLVPLPPMDGGQVAGALFEAVRRGLARVLRRPDPGYFDVAKLLPVAYVMAGVILVVSVVLVYADIVAPVQT